MTYHGLRVCLVDGQTGRTVLNDIGIGSRTSSGSRLPPDIDSHCVVTGHGGNESIGTSVEPILRIKIDNKTDYCISVTWDALIASQQSLTDIV
jgi:hypothetical protein